MRLTGLASLPARFNQQEPVPFQEILPLKLKQRVSGKGDKTSEVVCIHEMSVLFACLKTNDFNQAMCSKEISGFQKCYNTALHNKQIKKEQQLKGILTPGQKNLTHSQVNKLLRQYPNLK